MNILNIQQIVHIFFLQTNMSFVSNTIKLLINKIIGMTRELFLNVFKMWFYILEIKFK